MGSEVGCVDGKRVGAIVGGLEGFEGREEG